MHEHHKTVTPESTSDNCWESLCLSLLQENSAVSLLNLAQVSNDETSALAKERLRYRVSENRDSVTETVSTHLKSLKGREFIDAAMVLADTDPLHFGLAIIDGDHNFHPKDEELPIVIGKIAEALNQCTSIHNSFHKILLDRFFKVIDDEYLHARLYCEKLSLAVGNQRVRRFLYELASNDIRNDAATYMRDMAVEILLESFRQPDVSDYFARFLLRSGLKGEDPQLTNGMMTYILSGPITGAVANVLVSSLKSILWLAQAREKLVENYDNPLVIDALMGGLRSEDTTQVQPLLSILTQIREKPEINSALYQVARQQYKFSDLSFNRQMAAISATYAIRLLAGKYLNMHPADADGHNR